MSETKTCTKCGVCRPVTNFSKRKTAVDGLNSHCKCCQAAYRKANAGKTKLYDAKYRKNNVEKIRAYRSCYYAKNAGKVKEKQSRYYKLNRELARAAQSAYESKNPEKRRARAARWKAKNKEKVKTSQKKHSDQRIKTLSDTYVRIVLMQGNGIQKHCITQPLIEAKRQQIAIQRLINERKSK